MFIAWLWLAAAFWAMILAVAVAGWALPKEFVGSVFRGPHFLPAEVGVFTATGPVRTLMLMRLVANPAAGSARGLIGVNLAAPAWFRHFARVGLGQLYALSAALLVLLVLMLVLPAKTT